MVRPADGAERPVRTSVWLEGRSPRHRRSESPAGLDLDRITRATVRLLDEEGLAKFSMRRLAADIGVTAMSVYWYVDTKDDLLELALDEVYGELELPDPEASDGEGWRDRLREVAGGYRRLLVAHPWISPLQGSFLNIGPHSMAFSLSVQRIVGETGLPLHGRMGAISAVFQFVYGFGTVEGHFIQRCKTAGMTQEEYFREALGTITEEPELAKDFVHSTAIMEARGGDTVEEMRERDFTFALELMIAGIEAMVERAGPGA